MKGKLNENQRETSRNGNMVWNPSIIANILNKFFVKVSQDTTRNIPLSNKSPMNFMCEKVGNSFFKATFLFHEVCNIVSCLRSVI